MDTHLHVDLRRYCLALAYVVYQQAPRARSQKDLHFRSSRTTQKEQAGKRRMAEKGARMQSGSSVGILRAFPSSPSSFFFFFFFFTDRSLQLARPYPSKRRLGRLGKRPRRNFPRCLGGFSGCGVRRRCGGREASSCLIRVCGRKTRLLPVCPLNPLTSNGKSAGKGARIRKRGRGSLTCDNSRLCRGSVKGLVLGKDLESS